MKDEQYKDKSDEQKIEDIKNKIDQLSIEELNILSNAIKLELPTQNSVYLCLKCMINYS